MKKLGVNIDHVATLREARKEEDPNPVEAATICENAGADSIVFHLREDRRHINDKDAKNLKQTIKGRLNMEMSLSPEIVKVALKIRPDQITIVPEKREEVTTEGGLDLSKCAKSIEAIKSDFDKKEVEMSLFIDPIKKHIKMAADMGIPMIEIHTGKYATAKTDAIRKKELKKIEEMTEYGNKLGLIVNAGHGLNYHNVRPIAQIDGIFELNIGHSIISNAVFVGLGNAVREMMVAIK